MATIMSSGVSALNAFQNALRTTGHNIANANVEGYSRQITTLQTRSAEQVGSGWVGSGVDAVSIEREYDEFRAENFRTSTAAARESALLNEFASQLDNMLADPSVGLDPAMQQFFNAVQGLSDDPSSVASRQLFLSESQSLVDRFSFLNARFDNIREQLNDSITESARSINSLAASLANINKDIVEAYAVGSGSPPNDLLDQRDNLLDQLSQIVTVDSFEQDDGAVNVFVGNGQSLVVGTESQQVAVRSSTLDPQQRDIVFIGSTTQVITDHLAGGELGGMLRFQDELLNSGQNQLGLVAIGIAETMNRQHNLGLDLNGNLGGDLFQTSGVDININSANTGTLGLTSSIIDASNLTASDYNLRFDGGNVYSLTRLSDNTVTTINTGGVSPFTTAVIDGMELTITAGAAIGDDALVRPARFGAANIDLLISNTDRLAAAGPLRAAQQTDVNGNPLNTGDGAITQPTVSSVTNLPLTGVGGDITLTFDPNAGGAGIPGFNVTGGLVTTILYDPATESGGKTFTFATRGGAEFSMSGVPAAGDAFVISDNANAVGDNRNALSLGALQAAGTLLGGTESFQNTYGRLVSDVGSKTRHSEVLAESQQALADQAREAKDEVSGVNLDEEAANLLQFQQNYQAAAQVINTAQSLFDTLLSAVRR